MRTMRKISFAVMAMVVVAFGLSAQTTPWVTVYYAGWTKWNTNPVDIPQIDFSTGTHWIFFTLGPTSSGSFDGTGSGIDGTRHAQFVNAAHAAGRKAIIGTGGWGADYTGVVTNRTTSIAYLTNLITTYGYDGVDIDWEPVPSGQYANFAAWVKDLKAAMLNVKPTAILTAAAFTYDQALVDNRQYLDQINLMTYDMSGPWQGWVSWHNSALYDGGNKFPSTGGSLPSIDASVSQYITAGVPAANLGFGIEFYGYIWNGVTGPMQSGFGTVQNTVPYFQIMSNYGSLPLKWDAGAQASYYSTSNQFVSFDAETAMAVKANYVRSKGLGGVIIYEFAGGYQSNAPSGYKDRLIQKVKQAFLGGGAPPSDTTPPSVSMTAPAAGSTVAGQIALSANASDNVAVVGVQFKVDGQDIGTEVLTPPFTATYNTWKALNGTHTFSAVARDWSGNRGTGSVTVSVNNIGTPPATPDLVVFRDALNAPWVDASWSATPTYGVMGPGSNGTPSVLVNYMAWGGYDLLSGTWGAEVPVDVTVYDTLRFDIYPTTSFDLKIGFYAGGDLTIPALPTNKWTTVCVPTPSMPFSRFYIGNTTASNQTAYFDNVRFTAENYQSGVSGTFTCTPDTLPPGGGTIALQWTSQGATSASISPGVGSVALNGSITRQVTATTTFTLSLTGASGSASYAATVAVRSSVLVPPIPVFVFPASGAADQPTSLTLRWRKSAGATKYQVQLASDSLFGSRVVDDSTLVDTVRQVSGLREGSRYFRRVRAGSSSGWSDFSAGANFTTVNSVPKAPDPPAITSPAQGAVVPPDSLIVRWTRVPGAAQYHLQVSADSTFAVASLNDTTLTDTVRMVSGLTPGGQYFSRVRARNVGGWGAYSAKERFSVVQQGLAAPVLVSPTDGSAQVPLSATLSWNGSSGATSYELQLALDSGFGRMVVDSAVTSTSAVVGPLVKKTRYYWRVRASNAEAASVFSSSRSFRTLVSPPKPPKNLSVASAGPTSDGLYTFSWSAGEDAEHYRAQISEETVFGALFVDTTSVDTSVTVQRLVPQRTYYARVRSENVAGFSEFSTILEFSVNELGVEKVVEIRDYDLHQNYPNPFNPSTTIEFDIPVQSDVSIQIYNMLGMEVATLLNRPVAAGRHSVLWNAAGMPSGTYFCRFKAGPYVEVRRLLLVK